MTSVRQNQILLLTEFVSVLQLCALAQNFDKILVIKDIAKLIIKFSFSGEWCELSCQDHFQQHTLENIINYIQHKPQDCPLYKDRSGKNINFEHERTVEGPF